MSSLPEVRQADRAELLSPPKVLFVVEGFTDIRFVAGLSEISSLTIVVPTREYRQSGLDERIAERRLKVEIKEIPGDRLAYQARCLGYLWRHIKRFDVVLSQETLRGSLNSTLVGRIRGVPVVTYMCLPPVQYFRFRRERKKLGWLRGALGESLIRLLMTINGRLALRCAALGPYLMDVASQYCKRTVPAYYYGVDTELYRPATAGEKRQLRKRLDLPEAAFLILLASRISHEKDPETVLRATALARQQGLNATLINLGGGYRDFLDLASRLGFSDAGHWVLGRPAAHPMNELADYYRAADVVVQASLDEGLGMTPLEALACGVPAICTAVGGMARILPGYARLTPKQSPLEMSQQLIWVFENPEEARLEALRGRDYVKREWDKSKAFGELSRLLNSLVVH